MNPVYWNWKTNPMAAKSCGMVAQDVQQIAPDAVHKQANGLALNYNYFIGLLIARVQELSAEVQNLKS